MKSIKSTIVASDMLQIRMEIPGVAIEGLFSIKEAEKFLKELDIDIATAKAYTMLKEGKIYEEAGRVAN